MRFFIFGLILLTSNVFAGNLVCNQVNTVTLGHNDATLVNKTKFPLAPNKIFKGSFKLKNSDEFIGKEWKINSREVLKTKLEIAIFEQFLKNQLKTYLTSSSTTVISYQVKELGKNGSSILIKAVNEGFNSEAKVNKVTTLAMNKAELKTGAKFVPAALIITHYGDYGLVDIPVNLSTQITCKK